MNMGTVVYCCRNEIKCYPAKITFCTNCGKGYDQQGHVVMEVGDALTAEMEAILEDTFKRYDQTFRTLKGR